MSAAALTSLLKRTEITDHDEVLAAADAALKSNKNDLQAQHIKAVALLKLDRFGDAVRTIETGDAKLKEQAKLEYAYALYKAGNKNAAAELAQGSTSRGLRHVEAQALYGLEDFLKASVLYKDLTNERSSDNAADLRVNTLAVNAQLEWKNLGQHVEEKYMSREDFEAHETVYNVACNSIARGEIGQCEVLLKRAKYLCEKLEDLSEEEKAAEMLPITIQHIFVLTRQGRFDEARELSDGIDWTKMPDATTRYLAQVNHAAAHHSEQNKFLLERQLAVNPSSLEANPPFTFQKAVFSRNKHALDLAAMKFEGTSAATSALLAKQTQPLLNETVNSAAVANAAAHAQNQTGKAAIKRIEPLLKERPNDVGLLLTIVQLHLLSHNSNAAIDLLRSFFARLETGDAKDLEVRYAPGLVAAIAQMHQSQRRDTQACEELSSAASYWKGRSADITPGAVHLLKRTGRALLSHPDASVERLPEAQSIFKTLHERDSHDKYAAAGLLAADAGTKEVEAELPPIADLIAGIDVDALEKAGIADSAPSKQSLAGQKRAASEQKRDAKQRKSKAKTPQDPNKPVDPERWLPLRDRSSYKPPKSGKKDKKKQKQSQGKK